MSILAEVAVPIPLAHAFTYEVPASMQGDLVPGSRVLCDFGKQRIIGVVLRVGDLPRPKGFELRPCELADVMDWGRVEAAAVTHGPSGAAVKSSVKRG